MSQGAKALVALEESLLAHLFQMSVGLHLIPHPEIFAFLLKTLKSLPDVFSRTEEKPINDLHL